MMRRTSEMRSADEYNSNTRGPPWPRTSTSKSPANGLGTGKIGITLDLYSHVLPGCRGAVTEVDARPRRPVRRRKPRMSDDSRIVAFRPKPKPLDDVMVEEEVIPTAEEMRRFVGWGLAMRADGHMPDAIVTAFNKIFRHYWRKPAAS